MSSDVRGAIAERYAAALFELAEEQSAVDGVEADLRGLRGLIDESAELRRLLTSPVVGRVEQERAMAALSGRAGLHKLTAKFLGLLARNRRLYELGPIITAYLARLAAKRGEVTARVASAVPLSEKQVGDIQATLKRLVGRAVALDTAVDASLLGGLVVQVGSRMVDGSLKTKLQRLSLAMKGIG